MTVVGMEIKSFVQKYILNAYYVLVGILYTGTTVGTYMVSKKVTSVIKKKRKN